MVELIIGGVVAGILIFICAVGCIREKNPWKDFLNCCLNSIYVGMIVAIVVVLISGSIVNWTDSYEEMPAKTYALKEVEKNRFYETSTSGNAVSIYLMDKNGTFKKETYPEDVVLFADGDNAQVSIVKEKNDKQEIFFKYFLFYPNFNSERVKSVTITIPSSHQTGSDIYCTDCGAIVEDTWVYCNMCGRKI